MSRDKQTDMLGNTGSDLNGNTFWEFKESWNAVRLRRIVKYNPKTHYADVKVTRTFSHQTADAGQQR